MELKTARLTLLIDPNKKAAFEHLCSQLDLTPSQVVRQLIRDYLAQHDVTYAPSGQEGQGGRAAERHGKGAASKPVKSAKPKKTR